MSDRDSQDIITIYHLSLLGEGGPKHIPIYNNTSLFILSFYPQLPSEVCRANIVITPILEMRKLKHRSFVTCPRSQLGRTRMRSQIFTSQPNTLINEMPTAEKVVKVTVIY